MMPKHPKKVLVVVTQLNRGGLESRLLDIIRNLDFGRVQLDIFTCRLEPGMLDEEAAGYGSVIYYNKPLTVKNMFQYTRYFADFLKMHSDYQIVHAHQNAWCSVFCKGAQAAGVPVRIAHSRMALSALNARDFAKNVIKLPTRKYATHFFAVSGLAGEWLFGKKNVQRGNVQIWRNAIECNKFRFDEKRRQEKRNELGLQNNFVVLHVGNFTPPKNHNKIIKVFGAVSKQREDAVLLLAGEEKNNQVRLLVNEMQLSDKVRFLGNREDVNELMWAADVFLFPSIYEGMPGAVIEAQAAGLPCVVSHSVTTEVCITSLVTQISLEMSDELWADKLLEIQKIGRLDVCEDMKTAGYDVKTMVEELTLFYENVI